MFIRSLVKLSCVCSQLAPDVAAGLLAESGSGRGFGVAHQTQRVRAVVTVAAYTEHRCEESQRPMRGAQDSPSTWGDISDQNFLRQLKTPNIFGNNCILAIHLRRMSRSWSLCTQESFVLFLTKWKQSQSHYMLIFPFNIMYYEYAFIVNVLHLYVTLRASADVEHLIITQACLQLVTDLMEAYHCRWTFICMIVFKRISQNRSGCTI